MKSLLNLNKMIRILTLLLIIKMIHIKLTEHNYPKMKGESSGSKKTLKPMNKKQLNSPKNKSLN